MKILIYGAGIIGCVYSAKLHEAGNDITLLARDKTYERIKKQGLIIHNILTGDKMVCRIKLTRDLHPNDFYDLIIVSVRLDQLESVLPKLIANKFSPAIMFMLNNPDNLKPLVNRFPGKKVLFGFPGAGGVYENNRINYVRIKQQKTTIASIDDHSTFLINKIKGCLETAGFKVSVSRDIPSWLKTHAVFIACVSAAIISENGNSIQLGKNKKSVRIMVKSIQEGFKACQHLGIQITPTNLKVVFMIMPQWFTIWYWQKALQGKTGTIAIAPHARAAKGEMQLLAKKVLNMVHSSTLQTSTLDNLLSAFIDTK